MSFTVRDTQVRSRCPRCRKHTYKAIDRNGHESMHRHRLGPNPNAFTVIAAARWCDPCQLEFCEPFARAHAADSPDPGFDKQTTLLA